MSEVTGWGLNAPEAIHRQSEKLTYESEIGSYWNKFEGKGEDDLVVVKDELAKGKGEKVTFTIAMKLSGDGVEGDEKIEGTDAEEKVDTFTDALFIDQKRKGTITKGKMSDQRTAFSAREICGNSLKTWWCEERDQQYFVYATGERGINPDFHVPLNFTGRAGNPLQAPNAGNLVFAGNATSKADLDAADLMTVALIEKLVAKADTMDNNTFQPFMIKGEKKFVLVMHPWQAFQLRNNMSDGEWADIHKNIDSKESLLYAGGLGEYNGVILHKHRSCVRFSDYGSGGNVAAASALMLGAQALTCAYGRSSDIGSKNIKGKRFSWNEETEDRGNQLAVTAGQIFGVKKTRYDGKDFGVINVRSACIDPT